MKTIKQSLLITLLLTFSTIVSAQIQIGGKLGIGGATQSDFGNIYNNNDILLSYNAELTVKNQFNEWFALKTDLLYSQKGISCNIEENGNEWDQTHKYGYLTIPVKAEFSAPLNNSRLFVATGPYAGFLLHADKVIDSISTDIKDQTETQTLE